MYECVRVRLRVRACACACVCVRVHATSGFEIHMYPLLVVNTSDYGMNGLGMKRSRFQMT